jgi:hypothetical protein
MSEDATTVVTVQLVDDRAMYRVDEHFPRLIFLANILRWGAIGTVPICVSNPDGTEEVCKADPAAIKAKNERAIGSIAMLLADLVAARRIKVFSADSKLIIGDAELTRLVTRLRLPEEYGADLLGVEGFSYYVLGLEVLEVIEDCAIPTPDACEGSLLEMLQWKCAGLASEASQAAKQDGDDDKPEARTTLATAEEPQVYWRIVVHDRIKEIRNMTPIEAIKYLKRLGDRRLPNEGPHDELMWITEFGVRRTVTKKSVANELCKARRSQGNPG